MSLPYRLGSSSLFVRSNEDSVEPKRVVFLSAEGTVTEVNYFKYIEKYRTQLGIDAIVHIEILRKHDTNSDPDHVLALLEEYVDFRESKMFKEEISSLNLQKYPTEFIKSYLNDPSGIPVKDRHKFEATLREERIDLLYLDFLSKYHGKEDAFGVVLDRDWRSHTADQMNRVIQRCKEKNYLCYITNPCLEFWLLLHVSDVKREYAKCLDQILDNKVDDKGNSFVSNLLHEKTGQRKCIQLKTFESCYLPNIDLAIERAKSFAPWDELLEKIGSNLWELFDLLRRK